MRVNIVGKEASSNRIASQARTLHFKSEPSHVLTAIDNDCLAQRYPLIAPDYIRKNANHCPLKIRRQTFTTLNEKVESTTERPTMGGKTPYSVKHRYTDNSHDTYATATGRKRPPVMLKQHTIPSTNDLKLLSRRIDPNQPLSSPHDTPKKPPLPNALKRNFEEVDSYTVDAENMPPAATISSEINLTDMESHKKRKKGSFTCSQCMKVYKTKNGLVYHQNRCKSNKQLPPPQQQLQQQQLSSNEDDLFVECSLCKTTLLKQDTLLYQTNETTIVCAQCINNAASNNTSDINNSAEIDLFNNRLLQTDAFDNALLIDDEWNLDFASTWNGAEDPPSLLLSSSSEMFSSAFLDEEGPSQLNTNGSFALTNDADWFQFANFEDDFVNILQQEENNIIDEPEDKH